MSVGALLSSRLSRAEGPLVPSRRRERERRGPHYFPQESHPHSPHRGTFSLFVDITNMPPGNSSVLAGETWNFRAWFRDKNPGNTSNFTDGVSVLFK